jgi:hypothetical protein
LVRRYEGPLRPISLASSYVDNVRGGKRCLGSSPQFMKQLPHA